MVEAAGIEPASASPPLRGLHAYPDIDLTPDYPPGREDPKPAQLGFNGSDPEPAVTAILCG